MRKWILGIASGLLVLAMIGGGFAWWAIRQTQHVPEFYRLATVETNVESVLQKRRLASRRLTDNVERLQSAAAKRGNWKATFGNEEINAWLAEELPQKFPHLLRRGVSDARVSIEDGQIRAAARFRNRRIDTVISCDVKVELTEQANMLAVRLENLRAGALALPWSQFLDRISREAAVGDVSVQWDMTENGPVALLALPSDHPDFAVRPVLVESIELKEDAITLSGRSGASAQLDYRPRTRIHRFVSYRPDRKSRVQAMLIGARKDAVSIR